MTSRIFAVGDGGFVIEIVDETKGKIRQDIDFENGGRITTEERAIELRDKLIIFMNEAPRANAPIDEQVLALQQKASQSDIIIAELRRQNADMSIALASILGM